MSNQDKKLDSLLRKLQIEPPSDDLEMRIIASAKPYEEKISWREFLTSLLIPKPAYVLALTLAIGVIAGWQLSLAPDDGPAIYAMQGMDELYEEGDLL